MRVRLLFSLLLIFSVSCWDGLFAQEISALKKGVVVEADKLNGLIQEIATQLWQKPELALKEHASAQYLAAVLERSGFEVKRGVAQMPTAFVATYGSGRPVVGILAEFDALPSVGNAVVPEKRAREDGILAGHGCGHNLFAAASIGAAIVLKNILESHQLEGTVKLFGTPAEETVVGKVYMVKDGLFDGLDAALDWHPDTETKVKNQRGRAMNNFEVEFFGQAAHASSDPWNGRSALDAVELMNYGANLLREHIPPTARIHYVITNGGEAPNVVPEYAKVWYYVRDSDRQEVEQHYKKLLKIAEGAALATGTTHRVHLITGVHEYLLNRPLQEALQANLDWIGPVNYSEEEQQFAKALQRFLKVEEKGFLGEVTPLPAGTDALSGGSTDAAEVSHLTPTGAFSVTTAAAGIPWHSWATTACHGSSAAQKGALVAAKVIATTAIDLLTRPDLLVQAQEFFRKERGEQPYRTPLPENQPPPLPEKE